MKLTLIVLFALLLVSLCTLGRAHLPELNDENSEASKWADRQRDLLDNGCCGRGEAHMLEDNQWRTKGGDYEVYVADEWRRISRTMLLLRAAEDPNVTGRAVVWYAYDRVEGGLGGVRIYCFAPGWSA